MFKFNITIQLIISVIINIILSRIAAKSQRDVCYLINDNDFVKIKIDLFTRSIKTGFMRVKTLK